MPDAKHFLQLLERFRVSAILRKKTHPNWMGKLDGGKGVSSQFPNKKNTHPEGVKKAGIGVGCEPVCEVEGCYLGYFEVFVLDSQSS